MILKKKLSKVEKYLITDTDVEKYTTRYCSEHGIFQKRKDIDDGECIYCKSKCEVVENLKELQEEYGSKIEKFNKPLSNKAKPTPKSKKTTESIILKTKLKNLYSPSMIEILCRDGYRKTGNKFQINFVGSKGYFSHIEVCSEGQQRENNRLHAEEMFNKGRSLKNKIINIFHSEQNGVRVSLGKDKSRVVIVGKNKKSLEEIPTTEVEDDLPF